MERDEVTIRDLRNRGGHILDRVSRGESVTVTRDGDPIAELRPLPRKPLTAQELLRRWKHLPHVDAANLRADIDRIINPSL